MKWRAANASDPAEVQVGRKVRDLRIRRGLSLRSLASRSTLNVNTLSLIENGKSSPSVSTLQQLALALEVPIASFFESEEVSRPVVFTPSAERPQTLVGSTIIQNLGKDLAGNAVQPLLVELPPGAGSGDQLIVHTGHEFIYCLSGSVRYQLEQAEYVLHPGDSLVFEAHLPHRWQNEEQAPAQILLILYPADERDKGSRWHFLTAIHEKEQTQMKIALITDDGQNISQHFGRAPYYLVVTIEDGQVVNQEMRDKLGHNHFAHQERGEHHGTERHGFDPASQNRHSQMAQAISDCQAVICGGMGSGAYESMRQMNIQPIMTDLRKIDDAVQAYIAGTLQDQTDLLH